MDILKKARSRPNCCYAPLGNWTRQTPNEQAPGHIHPNLAAKVEAEVDKFVSAAFAGVLFANIVLIEKKNGQLRVCVNFKYLEIAYPNEDFPALHLELLINTKTDEALPFMDGYSWYDLVKIAPRRCRNDEAPIT